MTSGASECFCLVLSGVICCCPSLDRWCSTKLEYAPFFLRLSSGSLGRNSGGGGEVTESRPAPCDPLDCSPPGSSVHGILQARILEQVTCPPPGNLSEPGIEPGSLALKADSLPPSHQGSLAGTVFVTSFVFPSSPQPMLLHRR